jgi:hypothetical protein
MLCLLSYYHHMSAREQKSTILRTALKLLLGIQFLGALRDMNYITRDHTARITKLDVA